MDLDELNTLDLGSETTTEQGKESPSNETEIEVEDEGSPDPDVETEGEEQPEGEDQDDPWKGYVEVEIDGEMVKVPEKFKDGYLRESDYRRKTQATAELRRTLEGRQAEIEQMGKVSEEELQARSAKLGIEAQIKQYENVDWEAEYEKDPFGVSKHHMRFQQMKDAKQQIDQFLDQTQKMRTEAAERDFANRAQETAKFAKANLKGWTPELNDKLTDFAFKEMNLPEAKVKELMSPKLYELIYLAHLGKQTLSKQSAPLRPTAPPKPLTTVVAKGGTVRKTPATMSVDEMAAYLNKRS